MDESIGQRLEKLRKLNNFTEEQIADYLGFKQPEIAKLENNQQTLKSSSLNKLCELYNCNEEYILEGTDEYSIKQNKSRLNRNNINPNTPAKMNRIIKNIKHLNELNNNHELAEKT